MKKLSIYILPLLLLSACSIMDISLQETAVPLPPGKVDIAVYEGLGIELSTILQESDPESYLLGGWFVSGFKFGVPLSETIDLNSRVYFSNNTLGGKIGPKIVFSENEGHYLAAIPMFTTLASHDVELDYERYASLGGELTFVSTWAKNPRIIPTLSARVSYDRLFEENPRREPVHQSYHIMRGGVASSLRIPFKAVFLHPELGLELVPMQDGIIRFLPTASVGLGFQL